MRSAIIAALLALSAPAAAAEFVPTKLPDGRPAIEMRGEITSGNDFDFLVALHDHPEIKTVVFDSPGGLIRPALQIGTYIHERGLSTAVLPSAVCASACAYIWLGADHRYLAHGAHLGFHGVYGDDGATLTMTGSGNGMVGAYMARLGYSDDVVALATMAKPAEMVWIDPDRPFGPLGLTFERLPTP